MSRAFTLIDAMILILALAVGLAITSSLKSYWRFGGLASVGREVTVRWRSGPNTDITFGFGAGDYLGSGTEATYTPRIKEEALYWARQVSFWPGPCLAALSVAALGFSRRVRGPGRAVVMAVLLALGATAVRLPMLLVAPAQPLSPLRYHWAAWWLEFWFSAPGVAGLAVLVAWVALMLSGWRTARDWRDYLGLALGISWVVMAAVRLGVAWYAALRL